MAKSNAFDDVSQLVMLLNQAYQQSENDRRGHRQPLPPAHEVRAAHRVTLNQVKTIPPDTQLPIITASNVIYPSKNPFDSLERTSIDQLYTEVSAVGKYVIIRILEQGYHVTGWNTVVEDDQGIVCGLCVYNYPPQELFPVGTVLILKEPYFKISTQGPQFLRCDCPTDIIVLRPSHPLFHMAQAIKWKHKVCKPVDDPLNRSPVPAGANQWKERGNTLYNQNQLILAREAYQLGLQSCQQTNPTFKLLQLNLTAVNLDLGYFEKVIKISNDILLQFPSEKKALFRAGRAHYELRQYREALNHFEKIKEFHPNDDEGDYELERAKRRVHEMETGCVSIERLEGKKAKAPKKKIDCADYIGPVEVKDIPGKGRGVVMTKDVEPQTILIISKALAATLDPKKYFVLSKIVTKVAQLVTKNPKTIGPLVYDLSTGVEPREEIQQFCDPETKDEPICDVEKIKAICTNNSFSIQYEGVRLGTGLFVFPSYLNHSAVSNVTLTFYNDVMIVRAAQSLKVGDELFCTT